MSTIYFEQDGPIGIVRLNRPEVLNAINKDLTNEFITLLDDLEYKMDIRCMIVTGNERAFSAGADLKAVYEQQQLPSVPNALKNALGDVGYLLRRMETYPKPIIAAIAGIAYGGGCEISLACDVRVAAENARVCLSEVRLGVLPAAGGTQRLARLIGLSRAKYMLLSGEPIDAQTAMDWGLVCRVAPTDRLLEAAKEVAQPFLKGAPLSTMAIKAAALASTNTDLATGLEIEQQWSMYLDKTYDKQEGIRAFNEKRTPLYQGR
ncbi:MAG: enoyl-CoA hydratase/isomerase family protein [Bacillota bacterium]